MKLTVFLDDASQSLQATSALMAMPNDLASADLADSNKLPARRAPIRNGRVAPMRTAR
jgi:hypothetical protein